MKANPCRLCGGRPWASPWEGGKDYRFAVYCYNDLPTHDTKCNGHTLEEATERWNCLNPDPANPAPVSPRTIFALIRAKLRR